MDNPAFSQPPRHGSSVSSLDVPTLQDDRYMPSETYTDSTPAGVDLQHTKAASTTDSSNDWRPQLEDFSSARRGKDHADLKGKPRKIKRFYRRQNDLIDKFEELYDSNGEDMTASSHVTQTNQDIQRKATICAITSFLVNLLLFAAKMVSVVLSGSLAILSSVVDSAVDLISGAVLWFTSSAIKRNNYYLYPGGKQRMEPLAILTLSVIMSMASAMVLIKSGEQIQVYASATGNCTNAAAAPQVKTVDIVIICSTIGLKLVLFLVMWRIKLPSVQALAQDHRNDVLSNTVALIMGLIGSKYWSFADPIGAMVIALYIIATWVATAYQQIKLLAGRAAKPDFQKQVTWLCVNHHPKISAVETVIVYHFGTDFLVEVHIVLPEAMTVREAHDIQESLQLRLEDLVCVERAFVHIDYDTTHLRTTEHKML